MLVGCRQLPPTPFHLYAPAHATSSWAAHFIHAAHRQPFNPAASFNA
jgi:hypothetical protein